MDQVVIIPWSKILVIVGIMTIIVVYYTRYIIRKRDKMKND